MKKSERINVTILMVEPWQGRATMVKDSLFEHEGITFEGDNFKLKTQSGPAILGRIGDCLVWDVVNHRLSVFNPGQVDHLCHVLSAEGASLCGLYKEDPKKGRTGHPCPFCCMLLSTRNN